MPCWKHSAPGKTIDKLFVLDGCQDGPVRTILREAKNMIRLFQFVKKNVWISFLRRDIIRGVIASAAAYEYAEISDILRQNAKDKGEAPFIIFLDNIEDPHNLGAIIRTANLAGARRCDPEKKSSRTDSNRSQSLRRSIELHRLQK